MVGKKGYFKYKDDLGGEAGVLYLDISNTKAINTDAEPISDISGLQNGVNPLITPRHYIYRNKTKGISRKCYALDSSKLANVPSSFDIKDEDGVAVTIYISRYNGEAESFPVFEASAPPAGGSG